MPLGSGLPVLRRDKLRVRRKQKGLARSLLLFLAARFAGAR